MLKYRTARGMESVQKSETSVRKNEINVQKNEHISFLSNKKGLEKVKSLISLEYIPAKEWAIELGVSDRLVQLWRKGDREIPEDKIFEIVGKGPSLVRAVIEKAEDTLNGFINGLLLQAYGPSAEHIINCGG